MCLQEGHKRTLHLKKNVVPHKFECQKKAKLPPLVGKGALKRKKLPLVQAAVSRNVDPTDIYKPSPSTSSVNVSVIYSTTGKCSSSTDIFEPGLRTSLVNV